LKKDGVSNPLRRKRSRLELNILGLNAGAQILLGVGRNRGSGAENDSERESRQFLHGAWFEFTEYGPDDQEKTSAGEQNLETRRKRGNGGIYRGFSGMSADWRNCQKCQKCQRSPGVKNKNL
jgi:hypothetical protein